MLRIRSALPLSLLLTVAAGMHSAAAQSIFKCVDGETVAYQSMPCSSGHAQTEMRLTTAARASDAQTQAVTIPAADASIPVAAVRGRVWPPRRTLMVGMSDDEVLNLPGWGVPNHITRERKPREWREEWSYGSPVNGERRLHFVNATLVDIVDAPSSPQVASLTIQ
jgi:hypothetical protein